MNSPRPGAASGRVAAQSGLRTCSDIGGWQTRRRLKPDARPVGGIEPAWRFLPRFPRSIKPCARPWAYSPCVSPRRNGQTIPRRPARRRKRRASLADQCWLAAMAVARCSGDRSKCVVRGRSGRRGLRTAGDILVGPPIFCPLVPIMRVVEPLPVRRLGCGFAATRDQTRDGDQSDQQIDSCDQCNNSQGVISTVWRPPFCRRGMVVEDFRKPTSRTSRSAAR